MVTNDWNSMFLEPTSAGIVCLEGDRPFSVQGRGCVCCVCVCAPGEEKVMTSASSLG